MKKTVKEIIEFLKTAEEILAGEDFEDLGRKKKQAILDALLKSEIPYETDRDTDECYLTARLIDFEVMFTSHAEYSHVSEIRDTLDEMLLSTDEKWQEASISEAIDYLESLEFVPLGILNTSILTAPGKYDLKDISLEDAKALVADNDLDSAVGHASTAEIMTTLLGVDIPVNRQMFVQEAGQKALVFKLNGRPEEGKILSAEEIEQIGYKFQLLTRLD